MRTHRPKFESFKMYRLSSSSFRTAGQIINQFTSITQRALPIGVRISLLTIYRYGWNLYASTKRSDVNKNIFKYSNAHLTFKIHSFPNKLLQEIKAVQTPRVFFADLLFSCTVIIGDKTTCVKTGKCRFRAHFRSK